MVGDILELAARYRAQGADELVFYDITASPEARTVDRRWVARVARILDIPFCVAGGIATLEEAEYVLAAGAEKVSVNSPALADPALIERLARRFGSQCVVVGVDSLRDGGEYRVRQYTGDPSRERATGRSTLEWIREAQDRGAGEIVLNCMANDGVRQGFDLEQLAAARAACRVPLVASGGAGEPAHFAALAGGRRRRPGRERLSLGRHRDTFTQTLPARPRHRGTTMKLRLETLDWERHGGLLPWSYSMRSGKVLMLGYMNAEALERTLTERRVTFYSRSRQRLWTKGETSGNFLSLVDLAADCDSDALLVQAEPAGPTCHKGTESCFAEAGRTSAESLAFLSTLEEIIARRIEDRPDGSYTARLYGEGPGGLRRSSARKAWSSRSRR